MIKSTTQQHPGEMTRRIFITGVATATAFAAGGCATKTKKTVAAKVNGGKVKQYYRAMYGALPHEKFPIPAVKLENVPTKYYRQQVDYPTTERVGTIVVDTSRFFLYMVQENGMALRYGVGLGRAGFEWSGRARIGWKQEWPKWTPPDEMIARQPELAKWSAENGGMPPGIDNPLGARALYIFQDGVDTLYRVHGSPEYWTIGKAVSSGCVRLMNQDVIDLYDRVPSGSPILVM